MLRTPLPAAVKTQMAKVSIEAARVPSDNFFNGIREATCRSKHALGLQWQAALASSILADVRTCSAVVCFSLEEEQRAFAESDALLMYHELFV